jgi:hypothetical protein
MVNGDAQTSEKIALSKLLGERVLAPLRAAPPQHMSWQAPVLAVARVEP